jgi:hypothetical protein
VNQTSGKEAEIISVFCFIAIINNKDKIVLLKKVFKKIPSHDY